MASEDVIELGSSDDEAEPATKKVKPTPNAMVHIPRKFHDVTIKPATRNVSPAIPKELAGKNVTVTKISKPVNVLANPYAMQNKINGKQQQQPSKQVLLKKIQIPQKQMPTFTQVSNKPSVVQNKTVNPLSFMKKLNSQVVINKVPSTPKVIKGGIKIQSPHTINNLPPSITVTRTAGAHKRGAPVNISNTVRKKQKRNVPKTAVGEVLTVDLDDDEVSSSSTASPQWYLRPEEQTTPKLEEENNKEPEPKLTKEPEGILIEDSPVKPIKNKRADEVATELTVTIDDSPVKATVDKNTASGSDGEAKSVTKEPHSKKKLEYPKESEVIINTVEIEIGPMIVDESVEEAEIAQEEPIKQTEDNIIEIEESPLKVQGPGTSTPKKNHPAPKLTVSESIKELQEENEVADDLSEFHLSYQSFIRLCFQLENSDDMKKIVEKKIKTYYRQVPKEYTESEEFIEMVAGKVLAMKASPEKMYLYIKDIVDELNLQRKMAKSQVLSSINEKKNAESDKYFYGAESEYDSKRQRQIRKLEKTLKKLHRAIQKLEDQEVDFDDEEDSVYLLTESDEGSTSNKDSDRVLEKDPKVLLKRYKERMVRVHAKFCQLTNTKMPSEPRVQIDARPGQAPGPAKRLEKWVNKKVPIGTPLPFPDFHDVLRCVRDANDEDKLGWNEADIMEEARDLFTRCGKKLQRRRQENEWRIAASRISVEVDPAEKNTDLMKKLDDNKKIAAKKETEVFNKFADRQSQLKLEAEEIGDKEAEESPGDEDDEDEIQNTDELSLENKEKRKERLKRLLQEKSKKVEKGEPKKDDIDECKKDDALEDMQPEDVHNQKNLEVDSKSSNEQIRQNKEVKEDQKDVEINKKVVETKENSKMVAENPDVKINKTKIESGKLKEVENVTENEAVKTIDSDTVEIVTNDKSNTNLRNTRGTEEGDVKENKNSPVRDITTDDHENAHLISDDSSNKLESDVDELHLLQKLHSENEVNTSTLESSDSDTPIAISDTLGSSSDNKKHPASDVISIENSSYSESEMSKEHPESKGTSKATKIVEEIVDVNTELECSNFGIEKKQARTNNDEYNESIEDILLASTDDEVETDKNPGPAAEEESVNLKDDTLSIGDTVVEGVEKTHDIVTDNSSAGKQDDVSSLDSVPCVSIKDDSPVQLHLDTDYQDTDSPLKPLENVDECDDHKENETLKNTEDVNLAESENSVQSVNTIELKESSSEKEMEVIEECTNSLDSEDQGNSVEEVMEVGEEALTEMEVDEKSNSIEDICDAVEESACSLGSEAEKVNSDKEKYDTEEISGTLKESGNSLDSGEKENSTNDIIDAIDESMNSLQPESVELPKETSNKL